MRQYKTNNETVQNIVHFLLVIRQYITDNEQYKTDNETVRNW